MQLIGKYYGFLLFQNEDDKTIQIQHGVAPIWDKKYETVEDAKSQIREWKGRKRYVLQTRTPK